MVLEILVEGEWGEGVMRELGVREVFGGKVEGRVVGGEEW